MSAKTVLQPLVENSIDQLIDLLVGLVRPGPMSYYPNGLTGWDDFDLRAKLMAIHVAIEAADWDPRSWAVHEIRRPMDLSGAMWAACYVIRNRNEEDDI